MGINLRVARLQGYTEPDAHLFPELYALEFWAHIVEVYSKTAVTILKDKLIALSGMARWMANQFNRPESTAVPQQDHFTNDNADAAPEGVKYVAGLWDLHLESQLLWYVEPTFRHMDDSFDHLTTFYPDYLAPSFAWAAIDTDQASGIKYGAPTDRDLYISVKSISVIEQKDFDEFGLLEDARLLLEGKLRKATLNKKDKGRFGWRLVDRGDLDNDEHTIVYLDCPAREDESVWGPDADVYVVPAAKTNRKDPEGSKYLTCLILRFDRKRKAFRRIGLTKLSPYSDHRCVDDPGILEPYLSDVQMPGKYNPATGMRQFVLI
ncbi:heterokaryon incompatibility protein [Pyrenophora tritici-repentis]|uniref:Heterokaryon incompatibility protein n=2 Tax=Pyrenophora tritici-repentis TaxID=45151 RepID=A0A2W1FZS8_9PLEO|nr:uncharacterized protein PTRG_06688 [Pyrenophora tritici-repentis Pt-1C-BFP]KAA8613793.1 heterokaryon incompatibility protein [Pyrenophora tritici-repentis]EDU49608.1 predicted protein [Pyrenophora tritici-repentis Pt-1C-BFP]KAF7445513.1 heterokaryon incompatibility protein [Pyrenophora tritici-repentis]KAF7565795.1 hypothetical protein PtrM4_052290 [Pyrenophora tritici-repentis]KAI0583574.1 heterokaryon incompatibility protein [Pyrenophora tritici-repentis]